MGKSFDGQKRFGVFARAFRTLCLVLVLTIPVAMLPDGLYRFSFPKIFLLGAAVAIGIGLPSAVRIPRAAAWLTAGAVVSYVLAALASGSPLASLLGRWPRYDGVVLALLWAGLFLIGARLLGGGAGADSRRLWVNGLAVSMLVITPFAVVEAFGARPLGGGSDVRPGATLGNATDLGLVALVAFLSLLPIALWMKNWLTRAGAAAAALTAVCSGSRAVIAALLLGAVLLLGVKMYSAIPRRGLAPAIAMTIGVLGSVIVATLAIPATAGRLFSSQTVDGRWLLWEGALRLIRDNLLLGIGPGAFIDVFPAYQFEEFARKVGTEFPADSPHMLPLQLLVDGGIPLLAAVSALSAFVIVRGVKGIRGIAPGEQRLFVSGALVAVVGYGLALLTHFPSAGTMGAVCVLAGSLLAGSPVAGDQAGPTWVVPRLRRYVPAVGAVAAVIVAGFTAFGAAAETPIKRGYESAANGDVPSAERYFQTARSLRPWDGATALLAAQALAERAVTGDRKAGAAAVGWADAALEAQPASLEAATARAIGKLGSGGARDAVAILDEQIGRAPWTSELYLLRGLAHANLTAFPEAIADVDRSSKLTPAPKRALTLLAELYAADGQPERAVEIRQELGDISNR